MAHKYPLAKPMLLLKSDIEIDQTNIIVKMHIKGADFLRAKKTDVELKKVLKNLFGIDYKIELTEELSKKYMEEVRDSLRIEEEQIIAHIAEENRQNKIAKENDVQVPEYNDPNYMPPQELEGYVPEDGEMQELPSIQEVSENKEYIMGKPSKAKEKHINIKDITANDGRVTLEGKILTSEIRETRSGKGMIIFDLYDGTGRITCKSFSKDLKEGQEIIGKIDSAVAIKAIRKSRVRHVCRRCYSNCKYYHCYRSRNTRSSGRRGKYSIDSSEFHKTLQRM